MNEAKFEVTGALAVLFIGAVGVITLVGVSLTIALIGKSLKK
jgi:hypothetical protein